jgi:hypothetical protein
MKGVLRIEAFHELAMVVTIDKEFDMSGEGLQASRETSRSASQAFEVMTQIRIDRFHGVGLLLIGAHFIRRTIIQGVIAWKGIAVVLFGLRRSLQTGLESFGGSFEHHVPTQDTVRVSIHDG